MSNYQQCPIVGNLGARPLPPIPTESPKEPAAHPLPPIPTESPKEPAARPLPSTPTESPKEPAAHPLPPLPERNPARLFPKRNIEREHIALHSKPKESRHNTPDERAAHLLDQSAEKHENSANMSYLLQFPPKYSVLPKNIRDPPYVKISIDSRAGVQGISDKLPSKIPATIILHFCPQAINWIKLPDSNTKPSLRQFLLAPVVHMEIPIPCHEEGLKFVICRMLQHCNIKADSDIHLLPPDIASSIRILRAWSVFRLPEAGTDAVKTHILTTLWSRPPTASEIGYVWKWFPVNSVQVTETLRIVGQALKAGELTRLELDHLSDLAAGSPVLSAVFDGASVERQGTVAAATALTVENLSRLDVGRRGGAEIMERGGTRRVSAEEKNRRQREDWAEMGGRLRRAASVSSLASVRTAFKIDVARKVEQ